MENNTPPWKILKIVSKGQYNYAVVPNHPYATKNGYVLEHRIVVENNIGRLLLPNEIVHHKNELKKDNRFENLIITDNAEHARHHVQTGRKYVVLFCPWCEILFVKEHSKTRFGKKSGKYTLCSRSCNGHMSRAIQSNQFSDRLKENITKNFVCEIVLGTRTGPDF